MALPSTGLTVDKQPDILANIQALQQALIDVNITTDSDTILGQFNNIYAAELATLAELIQDVYDSRSLSAASGVALDDLVSILGLVRQGELATNGEQFFTCSQNNTTIPFGSIVEASNNSARYDLDSAVTVSLSDCRECVLNVAVNATNTTYTVNINGNAYSHVVTTPADTDLVILTGIKDAIVAAASSVYTASIVNNQLVVTSSDNSDLIVTKSTELGLVSVTSAGNITGKVSGDVVQVADSVATIVTPVVGWVSTTNPADLTRGRALETDDELRARASVSTASGGLATPNAIISALLSVTGVSVANLIEQTVSEAAADAIVTVVAVNNHTYTVTINGDAYSYLSDGDATLNEITAGVVADINGATCVGYSATDNMDGTYTISTSTLGMLDVTGLDANSTLTTESQPAGSIQCIVVGGANADVAQAIWDSKGAGVETFGAVSQTVTDVNGASHTVEFSRPTLVPADGLGVYVKVEYDTYTEETVPEQAVREAAISAAITEYGNNLGNGVDIIPQRFYKAVYASTTGLGKVTISMSKVDAGSVSEDTIPVGVNESAFFVDGARITFTNPHP